MDGDPDMEPSLEGAAYDLGGRLEVDLESDELERGELDDGQSDSGIRPDGAHFDGPGANRVAPLVADAVRSAIDAR